MPKFSKLRISRPAIRDLERIGAYTTQRWGADQKRTYLTGIRDTFRNIRDMPGIGASRDEIAHGLRAHPVQSHIIYYRETNDTIAVVRVLHRSMDPTRRITENAAETD